MILDKNSKFKIYWLLDLNFPNIGLSVIDLKLYWHTPTIIL